MINLSYEKLLTMSKNICKKFYDSDQAKFGPQVKTRDDEKNVIYSLIKISLEKSGYSFDLIDLQDAVIESVDEANIKKYSSSIPPSF